MSTNQLEEYILSLLPEFFSFSYTLLPEEFQAQQIVIDSITAVFIKKKDVFQNSAKEEFIIQINEVIREWVYEQIFILCKRRLQHNIMIVSHDSLSMENKAILFLKYIAQLKLHTIAKICRIDDSYIKSKLLKSRDKFLRDMNDNFL